MAKVHIQGLPWFTNIPNWLLFISHVCLFFCEYMFCFPNLVCEPFFLNSSLAYCTICRCLLVKPTTPPC